MACNLQTSFLPALKFPAEATLDKRRGNGLVVCSVASAADSIMTASTTTGSAAVVVRPRPLSRREVETSERKMTATTGKFGRFGGKFVPETLMTCLSKLEAEFNLVLHDPEFQVLMMNNFLLSLFGSSN